MTNRISAKDAFLASKAELDEKADMEQVTEILEKLCYPLILGRIRKGFTQAEVTFNSFDILAINKVSSILEEDGYKVSFGRKNAYLHALKIDWTDCSPDGKKAAEGS